MLLDEFNVHENLARAEFHKKRIFHTVLTLCWPTRSLFCSCKYKLQLYFVLICLKYVKYFMK